MAKNKTKVISYGGQALLEGVMMRGGSGYALCVRDSEQRILIASERQTSKKRWYHKTPVVRGMVSFVAMLVLGMTVMQKSTDAFVGESQPLSKKSFVLAMVLGLALSIGLFILLPSLLASWIGDLVPGLDKSGGQGLLVSSLIEAFFRLALFVLYLVLVGFVRDIKRVYMYHGAEHKTINCYERGYDMTVQKVQACSTRHRRCGTTFLFFVMVVSILVFSLVGFGLSYLKPYWDAIDNRFVKMGIRLLLLPVVAGLSYELLKGLAKLPDNWLARVLEAPGLALQRLTTKEPNDDMVEIAIASFLVAKSLDTHPERPSTRFGEYLVGDIKQSLQAEFLQGRIDPSDFDWIMCTVLQKARSSVLPFDKLDKAQYDRVQSIVKQRLQGVPLDYILGKSCFYGLDIVVDESVLIPRGDTERLCEKAITLILQSPQATTSVLDLCTGSGCLAKAIAHECGDKARLTAVDLSKEALQVAKQNLQGSGVTVIQSDLFANLDGQQFDFIVCNPPYIKTGEIDALDKTVQKEPKIALDGGEDGLDFYRQITSHAKAHLTQGGTLLLEIGHDQAKQVTDLLHLASFEQIETLQDYGGHDRVVVAK
ncbi:MAG: peptide chain release factor N(5)-glutamine methyltransferase [Firmicutes bacterium]|nr:peptide chain release factor N(5)-glutamine methyltransferase [Bacillota bacterium]